MKLIKNFLEAVAYYYYPKNLHESDPKYFESNEYQNYLDLHGKWGRFMEDFDLVLNEIANHFHNRIVLANATTANHIPCYQIEIVLNEDGHKKDVVSVFVSMFIPFYHIVRLKQSSEGLVTNDFTIPDEVDNFIENVMRNKLFYHKFPEELLNQKIRDLEVSEDFTFMSAFFTDYYRVVPPNQS